MLESIYIWELPKIKGPLHIGVLIIRILLFRVISFIRVSIFSETPILSRYLEPFGLS